MRFAILQAVIILGLSIWLKPDFTGGSSTIYCLWCPYIAYKVSKETVYKKNLYTEDRLIRKLPERPGGF